MSGPNAKYEITPFIYASIGRKNISDNSISELFQARYNIRPFTKRGSSSIVDEVITTNIDRTIVPKRHQIFEINSNYNLPSHIINKMSNGWHVDSMEI